MGPPDLQNIIPSSRHESVFVSEDKKEPLRQWNFKLKHSWLIKYGQYGAGLCKFILKVYWQWKKWATGCWRQGCTCKIAKLLRRPSRPAKKIISGLRDFAKLTAAQFKFWRWPKVYPKLILAANWVEIASCATLSVNAPPPSACYHILLQSNCIKIVFTFLDGCQQLLSIICQFERPSRTILSTYSLPKNVFFSWLTSGCWNILLLPRPHFCIQLLLLPRQWQLKW